MKPDQAGVRRITRGGTHRACVTVLDVTMNVYTKVPDEKTLKAPKRLGKQLGS